MNIQQLEYLVALDKHRQFVKASEECQVSQPTLSMMLNKLEEELDVKIFDRSKHPIQPTQIGQKIIAQAKTSLREIKKIPELIANETEEIKGELKLGVIPTISPYIIPEFIHHYHLKYPDVQLHITELETDSLIKALESDKIDMFLAATPLNENTFYEIPLYYEKFLAYFSSDHPDIDKKLSAENMPKENLWVLEKGHCLRAQVFNFCNTELPYDHTFEAGSIDTLVRIVDANGGYTIIPKLHSSFLDDNQKKQLREIENPPALREVSIIIKKDFIREKLINTVTDTIKSIIPVDMIDGKLKKYSVKLR